MSENTTLKINKIDRDLLKRLAKEVDLNMTQLLGLLIKARAKGKCNDLTI